MKQFDHYEFSGLLLPGATLIAGLIVIFPKSISLDDLLKVTFGSLGVFVVLSYVLGHLVQAVGNLTEWLWWHAAGGLPTDWLRTKPHRLLSRDQTETLQPRARERLSVPHLDIGKATKREWYAVTRQIHADVSGAGRSARVEIFNGNYGLHRGLAAALLCVAIAATLAEPRRFDVGIVAAVGSGLALIRMHRFGIHYARELFVQFLQLPPKPPAEEAKK